jgi:phage terminase small subunit
MKTPSRKALKEAITQKGIAPVLRIPKNSLTAKQRKFAEHLVLDEMTASDAYRSAYNTKGKPSTVNPEASRMMTSPKIAATIEAMERAKELASYHSSETLRSLVISTLTEVATSETAKDATRVAAVKVLGTVVGVDAFRETKRVEHVQNSGELRDQIMAQLKTMMLSSDDAVDVDADSLLAELAPIESDNQNGQADSPTLPGDALFATGTPLDPLHTIPHKPSQEFSDPESSDPHPSEDPPSSLETQTPGGYISGENDEVAK